MEQLALAWESPRRAFTVSELTFELRGLICREFRDVWVSGEISSVKLPSSGHYYFTLKDEAAQLRCVCYRMTARYLKFKPQDGVQVLAKGRLDVYDARGEVQMIVESLEPQGAGALQFAFEQLKQKLAAEGLFDSARKRPLPSLPQRIGVVTSPSGAVIRDILQILERRCPGRHIRVYPVQVQGETAAAQIAAGVDYFSRSGWPDVVIVARGGGSLEDLWAFNEETVARALAASAIPVISAVGHETDFTISDFVADLRAPTPSAAAEMVTATRQSLMERLDAAEGKLRQAVRLNLALAARRFHALEFDPARFHRNLGRRMQLVDELDYRCRELLRANLDRRNRAFKAALSRLARLDVRLRVAEARLRLEVCQARIQQAMHRSLGRARAALGPLEAHLKQLSPLKILERGYAIVERAGKLVKSSSDAPVGSDLRVRLAQGELGAKVTRAS
ncbi:MAG TPA: exodeoxyribonuclease VII large subunit [Bryobacteraceae bacterium]|nr:exodeoxyribonuclease VII large subunit [Bryobacteraceae bacterium]